MDVRRWGQDEGSFLCGLNLPTGARGRNTLPRLRAGGRRNKGRIKE